MRNYGLDLLRFIAVFLVIGRHLKLCPEKTSPLCHQISQVWQRGGWIGVDLFFVLSGFLISGLLFKEAKSSGRIDVKTFLIRRGFKIYPAFWILIGFTLVSFKLNSLSIPTWGLMGELLFIQNYIGGLWGHTWSLAVEEHFYFGIACLLFLFIRFRSSGGDPFRWIPAIFFIIAFTCLSLRFITSLLLPYSHQWHLFGTHIRIDSLMFGVFISWLWNYRDLGGKIKKISPWFFVALGVALLSPAFYFQLETTWWIPVFGLILFYLGSGVLLLASLRFHLDTHKVIKSLAFLGAYSYSIYLWHRPVSLFSEKILALELPGGLAYFLYFSAYLFGSFLLGGLIAKLIEYPILGVRDRFFPSKIRPLNARQAPYGTPETDVLSVSRSGM